jgi:hypothetical protein
MDMECIVHKCVKNVLLFLDTLTMSYNKYRHRNMVESCPCILKKLLTLATFKHA